jgi:hypothetical protein
MQHRKVKLRWPFHAIAEDGIGNHKFEKDHAGGDRGRRQMKGPREREWIGHAASSVMASP